MSDWPEDDGDAWAHQMQLEQRQIEEALARGREVLAAFRRDNVQFENEYGALSERVRKELCKAS